MKNWQYSVLLFLVLAIAPLLVTDASLNYMGKDMSQVAFSLMSFYPWAAVSEIAKLLLFSLFVTFILWTICAGVVRQKPIALVLFFFIFGTFSWSQMLRFPALFSEHVPHSIEMMIVMWPEWLGPSALSSVAFIGFLVCLLLYANERLAVYGRITVALLIAWMAWPTSERSISSTGPNVILIGIDSLRVDRTNLDSLASLRGDENALDFKDHIVGIPRTFPSWAEILYGRYAAETGIRHMFPSFWDRRERFQSMPEILGESGFHTLLASDFAGDIFPRFKTGFGQVESPTLTLAYMLQQKFDQLLPAFLPFILTPLGEKVFPAILGEPRYADPQRLVRKFKRMIPSQQKFFGTIFFSTAHFPYAAPYPYYREFRDHEYDGAFQFYKDHNLSVRKDELTDADKDQVRALYDGSLAAVDDAIVELIDWLKKVDLYEDTVIAITGDHGEFLFDDGLTHGHGEHLLREEVLRVPFVVKGIETPDDNEYSEISRSIDVATTLLQAVGLEKQVGHGRGLFNGDVVEGEAYSETGIWFARTGLGWFQQSRLDYPGISGLLSFDQGRSGEVVLDPQYEGFLETAKHRSLVGSRYKFVYMPTAAGVKMALFDRLRDPDNKNNLENEHPETFELFRKRLFAVVESMHPTYRFVDNYLVPQ